MPAGDAAIRGVFSGEKKRVSIAIIYEAVRLQQTASQFL
jgi:hypothetical protein